MPLPTVIQPAVSLPKEISGPASFSTPGVYRERLLVVCTQALFACISLHNGRLNQPNSLHISRSSNKFFPSGIIIRVLIYVLYSPVLSLLCLETIFLMNDYSLNMHRGKLKWKTITKKVNHFGTSFKMIIMNGTIRYF